MSKKVIYLYETSKAKMGLVRESLLSSIISDTYSFGIILFSFWINQQYIQSRMVSAILLFAFILSLFYASTRRRITAEEFKKITEKYLKEDE
jgi:hypothetical protein